MKTFTVPAISLLLTGILSAQCSNVSSSHTQLQWSESARLVSPDHVWELEVRPLLTSDENKSPVLLRRCGASGSRILLTLQRSAEAYWRLDSKRLLIVNEPVANSGELLLFDVVPSRTAAEEAPGRINEIIKRKLSQELGEKRHIEFYLPQFVSWEASDLVVAVGGATSSSGDGPMIPYCYGFLIDSSTEQIRSVISGDRLKPRFGKECRVSP